LFAVERLQYPGLRGKASPSRWRPHRPASQQAKVLPKTPLSSALAGRRQRRRWSPGIASVGNVTQHPLSPWSSSRVPGVAHRPCLHRSFAAADMSPTRRSPCARLLSHRRQVVHQIRQERDALEYLVGGHFRLLARPSGRTTDLYQCVVSQKRGNRAIVGFATLCPEPSSNATPSERRRRANGRIAVRRHVDIIADAPRCDALTSA
jgi:hypothetical protein